ncbi:TetR/AcrR family transcriptional regulator [Rhizobium cremeum]|uniref:TetR/AcrR family transcriptional regulator n=1 Tax=Rhizobium cremeum TaxID=2813827 RepID=UPI000DE325D7
MTANAYSRKKQPELVRRALLDQTAALAVEGGPAAITIQAVADRAGVTKGGLLHHFASKQALVEAVFADLLEKLDQEIGLYMAEDGEMRGRFTRAYIRASFADRKLGSSSPWVALSVSMISEPGLRRLWSQWLERKLAAHRPTDDGPMFEIARFAADGVWLADLLQQDREPFRDVSHIERGLLALASEASPGA